MADDLMTDMDDMQDDGSNEPYGAQILRRLHEDHSVLMEDYHNMMGPLEHEEVKEYLTGILEHIEESLSMTEELFGKAYSELPGLGEAGDKGEESGESMGEEVLEDEGTEDKDDTTEETGAVGADSSDREEERPDEDEVLEGMQAETKSLYGISRMKNVVKNFGKKTIIRRKKSVCGCKSTPCSCKVKAMTKEEAEGIKEDIDKETQDTEKRLKSRKKDQLSAEDVTSADGQLAEITDTQHPESAAMKALEMHEKEKVGEAAGFLKELGESPALEEEHRFKSYHYHKMLDEIGNVGHKDDWHDDYDAPDTQGIEDGGGDDPNGPYRRKTGINGYRAKWTHDDPAADYDLETSTGDDMHTHRKMCKNASCFLKAMAYEKAFGDPHRTEAMELHKALDAIANEPEAQEEMHDEESVHEPVEPGDMGEKGLIPANQVQSGMVVLDRGYQKEVARVEKDGNYVHFYFKDGSISSPIPANQKTRTVEGKSIKSQEDKEDEEAKALEKGLLRQQKAIEDLKKRLEAIAV